jgi:hypothetical protein
MTNTDKDLYRGLFNWSGETHELYTHAVSLDQAFKHLTSKLAKKLSLTRYAVSIRFINNQKDNYKIEKIRKER